MNTKWMLMEVYAEQTGISVSEVQAQIKKGWITGNDLFEKWLEYEGIIGYGGIIRKIIKDLEKEGLKIE